MKKKVLSVILLLAMVLSVAGCGKVKVKVGSYEGMVLTKVSDKEVEETIADLLKENAGCMEVDRAAAKDDTVNFDYKGIYYGDISITFKFELEEGRETYSFVPGTLAGTAFTALYTDAANNYATLKPAATAESGSNFYLNEEGAIVITNKEATSLTLAVKADYVKEIIEKQLAFTAKTNGVKITSMKVLAVSSAGDTEFKGDETYVGDGNLISSISYEAFSAVYGVAFANGSAEKTDLVIGSGNFIPGFEDGLIGHKAGEEYDIPLNFPDNYTNNTRLSGQAVIFQVKINAVKEDPEFNDAFAKYMEYDSIEEYRQFIVDTMNKNYYEEQISDELLKICTVENLSKKELQEYKDNFVNYYTSMAEYYAQYYTAFGYSITSDYVLQYFFGFESTDKLAEAGQEYAENYLSLMYIVKQIGKDAGLQVSEEEFNKTAEDYAQQSGYDTYKEFLEKLSDDANLDEIKEEINYVALLDKVFELVESKAVYKEAENTETSDKETTDK